MPVRSGRRPRNNDVIGDIPDARGDEGAGPRQVSASSASPAIIYESKAIFAHFHTSMASPPPPPPRSLLRPPLLFGLDRDRCRPNSYPQDACDTISSDWTTKPSQSYSAHTGHSSSQRACRLVWTRLRPSKTPASLWPAPCSVCTCCVLHG